MKVLLKRFMFLETNRRISRKIATSGHAVVIGASISGLLASRILVEHFERVTIIERDRLPQQPETRRGVPQAHHVHTLLLQGQRILEQLFPGIETELAAGGAPSIDWSSEYYFLNVWGWASLSPSDLKTRSCSRNFLECLVRKRLSSYANLKFITATQVKGLLSDESNSKITGVQISSQAGSKEQQLTADLVVDASGRNSLLPKWLEKIGYQAP
ncbi:MAG: 2-polyprenyl-6-methoxyphenol hydroxylase-like oxidoreductase, partial [Cyanobacteria bacterium J06649_11]